MTAAAELCAHLRAVSRRPSWTTWSPTFPWSLTSCSPVRTPRSSLGNRKVRHQALKGLWFQKKTKVTASCSSKIKACTRGSASTSSWAASITPMKVSVSVSELQRKDLVFKGVLFQRTPRWR